LHYDEQELPATTLGGRAGLTSRALVRCEMIDVVPVRSIVHVGSVALAAMGFAKDTPRWMTFGAGVSALADKFPGQEATIGTLAKTVYRREVCLLRKAGFYLYWPRELGGPGVPHPLGLAHAIDRAPRLLRKAMAVVVSEVSQTGWEDLRKLSRLWVSSTPGSYREEAEAISRPDLPPVVRFDPSKHTFGIRADPSVQTHAEFLEATAAMRREQRVSFAERRRQEVRRDRLGGSLSAPQSQRGGPSLASVEVSTGVDCFPLLLRLPDWHLGQFGLVSHLVSHRFLEPMERNLSFR